MERLALGSTFKSRALRKPDLLNSLDSIMFNHSRIVDLVGDAGELRTDVHSAVDLGISMGQVSSNGHEVWVGEESRYTFLLPVVGRLELEVRGREHHARAGQFIAFRPAERRTRAVAEARGGFRAITLQIDIARLQRRSALGSANLDAAFSTDGSTLTKQTGLYLANVLRGLAEDAARSGSQSIPLRVFAELGNLIDEALCELADQTVEAATARRVFPAYHKVRLAEEIMHHRCEEDLSMVDLARFLGVSLRSLQLAFSEIYGEGPRHVLTRFRLNRARSRLLAADTTESVTTIALDCGFLHLSRFAQAYLRRYGERPSETLSRRRR